MTDARNSIELDLVHATVEEHAVLIARGLLAPDPDPWLVKKLQEIDCGMDWRECLRQAAPAALRAAE